MCCVTFLCCHASGHCYRHPATTSCSGNLSPIKDYCVVLCSTELYCLMEIWSIPCYRWWSFLDCTTKKSKSSKDTCARTLDFTNPNQLCCDWIHKNYRKLENFWFHSWIRSGEPPFKEMPLKMTLRVQSLHFPLNATLVAYMTVYVNDILIMCCKNNDQHKKIMLQSWKRRACRQAINLLHLLTTTLSWKLIRCPVSRQYVLTFLHLSTIIKYFTNTSKILFSETVFRVFPHVALGEIGDAAVWFLFQMTEGFL